MEKLKEYLSENAIFLQENSLQKLSGGKDNITFSAILTDGTPVVIQCMRSIKNDAHADFMTAVIEFILEKNPEIDFSPSVPNLKRFYKTPEYYIQIMQQLPGKNALESDISENFILTIAKKLAEFHQSVADFPIENFEKINYHRDKVHIFKEQAEKFVASQNNPQLDDLIKRYDEKFSKISLDFSEIPQGIIHGDPVFKNFLINSEKEIVGWIDYDMLSYTYQIWDLADMYRGYTKMADFSQKNALDLLVEYEKIRPLSESERKQLPDFIRMMTLDTGYRYILALDENSGFYNVIGDSLSKAERCLRDYDKVSEWF